MDNLTPAQRSRQMALVKNKNTKPELIVRKAVYHLGLRYRLHSKELPGKPDMVFKKHRSVIFIHGCFWHQHPSGSCKLARLPKSRVDFWMPKLQSNHQRDLENEAKLSALGWRILVVWECELKDLDELKSTIKNFFQI